MAGPQCARLRRRGETSGRRQHGSAAIGIDEHRFRSVRYFQNPETKTWTRYEPWMTTIVDLGAGQVLLRVNGRDSKGVGGWLFARPLQWRLGGQVVAIDPSAAFRKALRMWLPRTAVAVDHFYAGAGVMPIMGAFTGAGCVGSEFSSVRASSYRQRFKDKSWHDR
ncbi:transposase [Arthrobacter crystallopoietes]|uniref:transposase n=1 Tax=Crystallibacter crystallopoietes TaxID=37928 RepID=UPI0009420D6A|nr:transposase [Arthrobacter crystallopoietes]AUI51862.1 hypothetical protein AC20117_14755 [Arthrobacter crystallopoietes]